ncbi:MAG: MATE family efflux transporter [Planctomycetota bacterium]
MSRLFPAPPPRVLGSSKVNRKIMVIAWPVMLSNLSQTLLTNIDFIMVGQVSTDALAAVGVASTFMTLFYILGGSLSFGLSTCVSIRLGEQDHVLAGRVSVHGLIFGVLLGALLFVVSRSLLSLVFGSMELEPEVRRIALEYSELFVWGLWLAPLGAMAAAVFGAYTRTRQVLVSSLIMVGVNLVGDYMLIFGKFGAPAMGPRGAALASVLAVIMSTAYLAAAMWWLRRPLELSLPRSPKLFGQTVASILRLGISTTIEWLLWFVGIFIITIWLAPFGAVHLALFHVSMKLQGLLMLAVRGFTVANNAMIGRAHGGQQPSRISMWHYHNLRLCLMSLVPGILLLTVWPSWIFGWFIDIEEIRQIGSPFWIGTAVVGVVAARMVNTLTGSSLRSVGVLLFFIYLLLISQAITLGFGYAVLRVMQWGFWGALAAAALDEVFRGVVSTVKLRRLMR